MTVENYDVLVIGGGHAGAEAAWAASGVGAATALVTFQREAIGRMSCNPAIGGIGKGQMVREIDALGGLMGLVADETGIQFRMLNRRKGPAVRSPRCQSDSARYADSVRRRLEDRENLDIIQAGVESIETEPLPPGERRTAASQLRVTGVRLRDGSHLAARTVVVTSGTFLRALMHTGPRKTEGGRVGESAAIGLSASLKTLGLELKRLKTGTPPRVARDSIDFTGLVEQPGDDQPSPFSFMTDRIAHPQTCCWITHTDAGIHDLIRANLHRAPMYSGQIAAHGPRYCPSIEDKVVRFADKQRHQVFLEPEGLDSDRIYLNGISTSLPDDVQAKIVTRLPGLSRARVLQWGYAVEYDYVPPEQIDAGLMTKRVAGLFLAGQINGTSGYEEAAGQGLLAGVNAARFVARNGPIVLGRDQAYIGVMIDDLVTRGLVEPYRMFTSRAEHRLHLRSDNADVRLTPLGRQIGLVSADRWIRFSEMTAKLSTLRRLLQETRLAGRSIAEWLKQPEEVALRRLEKCPELADWRANRDLWSRATIEIRYSGYIARQRRAIAEFRQLEQRSIPPEIDYAAIRHLRREAVERWCAVRPRSVGQAARVSGIRPMDVQLLLVYLPRPEPIPLETNNQKLQKTRLQA